MTCYACACCSNSRGKSHAAWQKGTKRTAALISCQRRHTVGCPSRRGDRGEMSLRMGMLLCLFALVVQLVLPVTQTWHIAAELAGGSAGDHVLPQFLGNKRDSLAGIRTDTGPQRAPNDSTLCPICHSLLRIRDFIVTQPVVAAASAIRSWFVPFNAIYACCLSLHASAPRAPPSLS
jgi:hypothetical protein